MRRVARAVIWAGGALAMVLILVDAWIYFENLREVRRAERMLDSLRDLKVGRSSQADVERVLAPYPSIAAHASGPAFCAGSIDAQYWVILRNDFLNRYGTQSRLFRLSGFRPWGVEVGALIGDGRLCAIFYRIGAWRPDVNRTIEVEVLDKSDQSSPVSDDTAYAVSDYPYKSLLWFKIKKTTRATDEQQQHATDLKLMCLGQIGGCRAPCELAPSAWQDYKAWARRAGAGLPAYEQGDSRCVASETGLAVPVNEFKERPSDRSTPNGGTP